MEKARCTGQGVRSHYQWATQYQLVERTTQMKGFTQRQVEAHMEDAGAVGQWAWETVGTLLVFKDGHEVLTMRSGGDPQVQTHWVFEKHGDDYFMSTMTKTHHGHGRSIFWSQFKGEPKRYSVKRDGSVKRC